MSESNAWDFSRSQIKEWWKRRRIQHFAAALVGGSSHLDYLVELGMGSENISLGYDAIDNAHFSLEDGAGRNRPADVPEDPFFLASARFVSKKNLAGLIRAFHLTRTGWHLVVLGDGELRAPLEALVTQLGVSGRVHFPGFKQYGELPAYYSAASAFVHASTTEQWGLVVNEALASGLPVLVSDRCGCAHELDVPTFDPGDTTGLARMMEGMCHEKHSPRSSVAKISAYGPDRFAAGLFEASTNALRK
jgi:glycosyltransferase involved in cell wall biosynthesis